MAKRYIARGLSAAILTMLVVGTSLVPSVKADDMDVVAPPVVPVAGTDWVQVSTAGELEYIDANQTADIELGSSTTYLNANIELMNSIDLPTGYAWVPLGESAVFAGVFNGNGYEVTNVSVSGSYQFAGFFGFSDGIVENVGVEGTFSSTSSASVPAVGGLMGDQNSGSISDSYATGSVSSSGFESENGGLVGWQAGSISDCYATASVHSSGGSIMYNGGLVGQQVGTISDSYATGAVSGGTNGGLVGYRQDGGISDSYFDTGTTGQTNGVGQGSDSGVTGKSTADMQTESTYTNAGWDFTNTWAVAKNVNGGYPYLASIATESLPYAVKGETYSAALSAFDPAGVGSWAATGLPVGVTIGSSTGILSGTPTASGSFPMTITMTDAAGVTRTANLTLVVKEHAPDISAPNVVPIAGVDWVQVSTEGELLYIDEHPTADIEPSSSTTYLNANIELMNSIDLIGDTWSPLGTESNPFDGVFNGHGYEVTNVSVSGSDDYAGFFGVSDGTVENIGVEGSFSSNDSGSDVGALVGEQDGGSISDSYATGSVSGSGGSNGGLVGAQYGSISDSYATGAVSGDDSYYNGGLVGYTDEGTINDSYASGSVSDGGGSSYNGGLVGYADEGSISDSYATGAVSGDDSYYNGGLVGYADEGSISDSYATGAVSGDDSYYNGGLVGYMDEDTISDSYFDEDTSGMSSGVGYGSSSDVTPESTTNMQTPSTFSSWSASDWTFYDHQYPLLSWQVPLTISMTSVPTVVGGDGQVTVTGSVYSNDGTPLSGVNVNLIGASGTWAQSPVTTDASGDYIGQWTAPNTTQDVTVTASVYGASVQQQSTIHVQAYTVTYDSNGATGGTAPTDSNTYMDNQSATVLGNTGNLMKTGYAFAGWNTKADGSGTSYAAGSSLPMSDSNITLYAQWALYAPTGAPTGLQHSDVTQTGWMESWSPVSGAVSYDVYLNGNQVGSTAANVYSYTFTGEQPGTTYQVGVSSVNGSNQPSGEATDTVTTAVYGSAPTPPFINTISFPEDAQVGVPYSKQIVVTGGAMPYTWSIASGSLPPGLTLNNEGEITGTPTGTGGSYTFTVKVTGENQLTATRELTLKVDAAAVPSITPANLWLGTVGQSYTQTLAATGGTMPYTWDVASGTLPAGLSLDAATGEVSGTPTKAGVTMVTVEVTDAKGQAATEAVTIDVMQPYERAIVWNGQVKNVPAIVGNDGGTQTTYMPIWYVMQLLKSMGIESTWNGHEWQMTTSTEADLSDVQAGTGSTSIYLNGTLVQEVNTEAQIDPSTEKPTTYMPIWYVQEILNRVGLTSTWNGTTWTVTQANS